MLLINIVNFVQIDELPLNLTFDWTLVNLLSFTDGKLKMFAQITFIWQDSFRSWDYSQIPIFYISLPASEVWTPRFSFLNAVKEKYANLGVRAGDRVNLQPIDMFIVFSRVLEGKCEMNLWNFPFDKQTCELVFLLDRFYPGIGNKNVLMFRSFFSYHSKSIPNAEWNVLSTITDAQNSSLDSYAYSDTGVLPSNPIFVANDFFVGFKVLITLQRHWIYYLLNILIPVFVLSALTFVPFALDEDEPEKIATGIAVILGFMFIQGIVAELLPKSHLSPYLADYIASVILLSALSVIANLISYATTVCHHTSSASPGPVVRFVVLGMLQFLIFPSKWVAMARHWLKQKKSNSRVHATGNDLITQTTDSSINIVKTSEIQVMPSGECDSLKGGEAHEAVSTPPLLIEATRAKEWYRVAYVLNRFFALLHLAGSISLFSVFLLPIMISS